MFKKYKTTHEISFGLKLDEPNIMIPWDLSQNELIDLFNDYGHELKEVTIGYFTTSCVSLNGLSHELGIHYDPRTKNTIKLFEFFRKSYVDNRKSFNEFQSYFENYFGYPTQSYEKNAEGFESYEWKINKTNIIRHYVVDRFGLEEHLHITKING